MKLREGEDILHSLKPSSRVLIIWFFTKVLWWSIGFGFFSFWVWAVGAGIIAANTDIQAEPDAATIGLYSAMTVVLSFASSFIYAIVLRGTYRYYITSQRCVFVGGIVRYRERSIPYHKITDVELSMNLIERAMGMSSIRIFTPGTSSSRAFGLWFSGHAPELSFEGLSDSEEPTESINLLVRDSKDAVHS